MIKNTLKKRKAPIKKNVSTSKGAIASIFLIIFIIMTTVVVALSDAGKRKADNLYNAIKAAAVNLSGDDLNTYYDIVKMGLQETIDTLENVSERIGGSNGTGDTGSGTTGTGTTGTGTTGSGSTGTGTTGSTTTCGDDNICGVGGGVRITVLDADTNQPVPGVDVGVGVIASSSTNDHEILRTDSNGKTHTYYYPLWATYPSMFSKNVNIGDRGAGAYYVQRVSGCSNLEMNQCRSIIPNESIITEVTLYISGYSSVILTGGTCTSFTYSDYSACQSNNTQVRSILTKTPSGCTGGTPEALSKSCTVGGGTCTSFTYSDYSACQSNNTQVRSILTSTPSGCTGGTPEALSKSCTYTTSLVPLKITYSKNKDLSTSDFTFSAGNTLYGYIDGGDINNTWACLDGPDAINNCTSSTGFRQLTLPINGVADDWQVNNSRTPKRIESTNGLLLATSYPVGLYTSYVRTGQNGTDTITKTFEFTGSPTTNQSERKVVTTNIGDWVFDSLGSPTLALNLTDTNAGSWNVGAGTMQASMDFISEGYFQNSGAKGGTTSAHMAIVLRNDGAKIAKNLPQNNRFIFGQGMILGDVHLATPVSGSTPNPYYPSTQIETWFNGIGNSNYLLKDSNGDPNKLLQDYTNYHIIIDSIRKENGDTQIRYRIYRYAADGTTLILERDTGNMSDGNIWFDPTKTGFAIGEVLANKDKYWKFTFKNIVVKWGPVGME